MTYQYYNTLLDHQYIMTIVYHTNNWRALMKISIEFPGRWQPVVKVGGLLNLIIFYMGGETWWIVYFLPMIYIKEREGIGEERGFHLSSQDHILVAKTTSKDFHMPKDPYSSILDAESHTRRTLSKIWFAISEFEISWV